MEVISPMVTMLAERMRTNPEDFIGSNLPKFFEIAQTLADMIADPNLKYYWFLNDTEKEMLMGAYRDLCRKRFEDNCMEKLLGDKEEHRGPALGPASVKYKAQGRYQTTPWVDPRSLYGQREDLLRRQEDLIRVSASENGINQIQTLSLAQRINGALNKLVNK